MKGAIISVGIATVALGALHRMIWFGLNRYVVPQEYILLGVSLLAVGFFALTPRFRRQGLWPSEPASGTNSEWKTILAASGVLGLVVVAWILGSDGMWRLPADDNAAWLSIASASKIGSTAPVHQGVAVAVLLSFSTGVARFITWCVGIKAHPWEIWTWSVVGTYSALTLTLPTLAQKALQRRIGRTGNFLFLAILNQISVIVFAIEAIRFGHLTALLLCFGLLASLPRVDSATVGKSRAVRWVPFACCLSMWLGTVPLSVAVLGAIIVVSFVPWRSARLGAVAIGGLLVVFVGRQFAVLLPWGGSVVEVKWLSVFIVLALAGFALVTRHSISLVLVILTAYTALLALANLWRSGSIDYGVSKAIWILMPVATVEILAVVAPVTRFSKARGPKGRGWQSALLPEVVISSMLVVAVSWSALATVSTGLRLGEELGAPHASHWRDLGSSKARLELPTEPIGCLVVDGRNRPVLTADSLYRCNRFVTAVSSASMESDSQLGQVFQAYAVGQIGLGGVLEEVGASGFEPSRVLIIGLDGTLKSTTMIDLTARNIS